MVNSVKGVFHVQFNYHSSFPSVVAAVYSFLNEDDVVSDLPVWDKTSLILRYQVRKEFFEPIGKNFGYNLVGDIAERYGAESIKGEGIHFLGDKSYVRRLGVFSHLVILKDILDHPHKIFFDCFPMVSVEGNREAIRSRGLVLLHTEGISSSVTS